MRENRRAKDFKKRGLRMYGAVLCGAMSLECKFGLAERMREKLCAEYKKQESKDKPVRFV